MTQFKNRSVLVVGGTGFIGTNLIEKLLSLGSKITCLSLKKKNKRLTSKNLKYIFCDYKNFKSLRKKINKHYDYVINLGGYIDHSRFFGKGRVVIDDHFLSTMNILMSIKRKKIKRYLHVGTCDEYGSNSSPMKETFREDPISPYAVGKVASVNLLTMLYKTEKFPVTILRVFNIYGPKQRNNRLIPQVINGCLNNKNFPVSKGTQLRTFF
jgi:nucleoside-diphosphate-sugar epimerase